jgi:hypothetical protein
VPITGTKWSENDIQKERSHHFVYSLKSERAFWRLRVISRVPVYLQVSSTDYGSLEDIVKKIVKEKQPFERLELTKEQLMDMFQYNEFKLRILKNKVDTPTTTVYRCGPLIDLCRGPHVRHTGKVKAFQITRVRSQIHRFTSAYVPFLSFVRFGILEFDLDFRC